MVFTGPDAKTLKIVSHFPWKQLKFQWVSRYFEVGPDTSECSSSHKTAL